MNGPISLYDVERQTQRPALTTARISLKNFSGEADIKAVNGPISVEDSSGGCSCPHENGPISVSLTGKTWSARGYRPTRKMAR